MSFIIIMLVWYTVNFVSVLVRQLGHLSSQGVVCIIQAAKFTGCYKEVVSVFLISGHPLPDITVL